MKNDSCMRVSNVGLKNSARGHFPNNSLIEIASELQFSSFSRARPTLSTHTWAFVDVDQTQTV